MSFPAISYIAAAVGYLVWDRWHDDRIPEFTYPQSEEQFVDWFGTEFSGRIDKEEAASAIMILDEVGLVSFDEDEFAGRFLRTDASVFNTRWEELARSAPESPFGKANQYGKPWFEAAFSNPAFWEQLRQSDHGKAQFMLPSDMLRVPEAIIFIADGSQEARELSSGLITLAEELRSNNEIANELGEDRGRILSEISASHEMIKSGVVRSSAIREILIKVLREIGRKLKDKAIVLGVDKLLEIAIHLVTR